MNETVYNDLADWLGAVEATTSPSSFHGQITGLWCRHKSLPQDLALDEVNREAPAWQALIAFGESVRLALEDPDCSFAPLLPPDHASLRFRGEALVDFSEGLLFGLGAAGALDRDAMSPEVQELLRDLAEICRLSVDEDDGEAEEAYAELVEFLKVAAQTLYVELHQQAG